MILESMNKIIILDNLSTGDRSNIKDIINDSRLEFRKGTVLDLDLVNELCKQCDVVYHLAAAVGVKYIVENPLLCLDVNIIGTSLYIFTLHLRPAGHFFHCHM